MLGFQREYLFLARHLGTLAPSCEVLAVWRRGSQGSDLESALALPHPILQFAEPNRRLHPISSDEQLPTTACACYLGATCQLDENADVGAPDYAARLRTLLTSLRPTCDRLAAMPADPLVEEDGPATPNHWPYRNGRLRLGIYNLVAARPER